MSLAIANRYARALADVLLEPGSGIDPVQAVEHLRAFAGLLRESAELHNVLMSPAVPLAAKRNVAARLADRLGFPQLLKNFIFVALDHRRAADLDKIAGALEIAVDERLGRVRAEVSSAAPLTGAQQDGLAAGLARMTGKQIRTEYRVDSGLLGGVSVRIGSKIYDGSVRGRLETLRRRLIAH